MDNLIINHTQTDRTLRVMHEVVKATKTNRKHYVLIVMRKGVILHTRKMSLRKIKQFVKAFKGVKQQRETRELILLSSVKTQQALAHMRREREVV